RRHSGASTCPYRRQTGRVNYSPKVFSVHRKCRGGNSELSEILTALSITRFEGSRWCLRRTRLLEKVRECGLMSSREETRQVGKVGGEEERVEKVGLWEAGRAFSK